MNRSGLPGRRGADSISYAPIEEAGMWSEPRAVRIALAALIGLMTLLQAYVWPFTLLVPGVR